MNLFFVLVTMTHAGLGRIDQITAQGQTEPGSHASCGSANTADIVSVNVGFSYPNDPKLDLHQSPLNDTKFYRQMAGGFTPKTKIASLLDSAAPSGSTKEDFLAKLRSVTQSAKVINFNYAGHGLQTPNGEFALLLPSVPKDVVKKCTQEPDPQQRGLVPVKFQGDPEGVAACADLQKYLVTASDLKSVFGDRKVFGIIDACHAGSFDLGKNTSMMLSAGAKELARRSVRARDRRSRDQ